jgi:hypothetical protein
MPVGLVLKIFPLDSLSRYGDHEQERGQGLGAAVPEHSMSTWHAVLTANVHSGD